MHVTSAEVIREFVLSLSFDDDASKDVDVAEFLRGPVLDPLGNDPDLFRQVRIEGGTTVWPNGADIDLVVLHGSAIPAGWGRIDLVRRKVERLSPSFRNGRDPFYVDLSLCDIERERDEISMFNMEVPAIEVVEQPHR